MDEDYKQLVMEFMHHLVNITDENGDETALIDFFNAEKDGQKVMFSEWLDTKKQVLVTRKDSLEEQKAQQEQAIDTQLANLESVKATVEGAV